MTGGQVRCWGYGGEGELGYPGVTTVGATDTPASAGPVDIGSGYTATAISSGDYHTCVIRNDGSVLCWGFGADGRLGYGNTANVGATETPGSVGPVNLGPGHTAKAISAGGGHTCAILDDGSVRCWGFGYSGQLGDGGKSTLGDTPATTPDKLGPVD
ncbi:MAG: chromosome condensation regulator, partial [Actinomycetota bacterium]|nr:chromosome condensation regulator [Actinomycetota bacterium]